PLTVEHIVQRYINYLDYFVQKPDHSLKDRQQQKVKEKPAPGTNEESRGKHEPRTLWHSQDTRDAGSRKQNNNHILIDKFERQALETPGNIAVKSMRKTCTYRDLNRNANRIARQIIKNAPGKTVGLFFQQGIDMIAAILGTLKAGKIYVPLSVEYPAKRLAYMLADSGTVLLLTNSRNEPAARQLVCTTPMLKIEKIKAVTITAGDVDTSKQHRQAGMESEKKDRWNPEDDINPPRATDEGTDKIAYILYTSGTTGRPKGVAQTQTNVDYFIRNW
ncbi:MAG: AMP-binding protein, partial [bacterium]|nr:AMP-binding protein [bacterium]